MKKLLAVLLAVLIVSAFAVPAFAADSPGGDGKYTIDIYYHLDTTEHLPQIEVHDGDTYTFTLEEKSGYEFDHIEIIGKDLHEIINSTDPFTILFDLNGGKADYVVGVDIEIHVYYKEKTPVTPDPTPVSPPTGSNILPFIALILVALFGIAFATRKLIKNH